MEKKKDVRFFWFVACKCAGESITYPTMKAFESVDDSDIMVYLSMNVLSEHKNVEFVEHIDELVFVAIDVDKHKILIEPLDEFEFWPINDVDWEHVDFDEDFLADILSFTFDIIYGSKKGGEKKSNGKD